ncbi:Chromosome partition protein Smc [Carpediemonas membranifera]|uniref:Chromosome partition protein Smc n=1 Tax=Carpediemonas membranifera TaxID=201153 RepID=A0A8J6B606_9EUKA|nr:Chromosome partition protein Smc [Carpediemonas membranifera]|eukprot:KAG9393572.1 Chromosome partition protein Smc [Carpediemonas membranifera]
MEHELSFHELGNHKTPYRPSPFGTGATRVTPKVSQRPDDDEHHIDIPSPTREDGASAQYTTPMQSTMHDSETQELSAKIDSLAAEFRALQQHVLVPTTRRQPPSQVARSYTQGLEASLDQYSANGPLDLGERVGRIERMVAAFSSHYPQVAQTVEVDAWMVSKISDDRDELMAAISDSIDLSQAVLEKYKRTRSWKTKLERELKKQLDPLVDRIHQHDSDLEALRGWAAGARVQPRVEPQGLGDLEARIARLEARDTSAGLSERDVRALAAKVVREILDDDDTAEAAMGPAFDLRVNRILKGRLGSATEELGRARADWTADLGRVKAAADADKAEAERRETKLRVALDNLADQLRSEARQRDEAATATAMQAKAVDERLADLESTAQQSASSADVDALWAAHEELQTSLRGATETAAGLGDLVQKQGTAATEQYSKVVDFMSEFAKQTDALSAAVSAKANASAVEAFVKQQGDAFASQQAEAVGKLKQTVWKALDAVGHRVDEAEQRARGMEERLAASDAAIAATAKTVGEVHEKLAARCDGLKTADTRLTNRIQAIETVVRDTETLVKDGQSRLESAMDAKHSKVMGRVKSLEKMAQALERSSEAAAKEHSEAMTGLRSQIEDHTATYTRALEAMNASVDGKLGTLTALVGQKAELADVAGIQSHLEAKADALEHRVDETVSAASTDLRKASVALETRIEDVQRTISGVEEAVGATGERAQASLVTRLAALDEAIASEAVRITKNEETASDRAAAVDRSVAELGQRIDTVVSAAASRADELAAEIDSRTAGLSQSVARHDEIITTMDIRLGTLDCAVQEVASSSTSEEVRISVGALAADIKRVEADGAATVAALAGLRDEMSGHADTAAGHVVKLAELEQLSLEHSSAISGQATTLAEVSERTVALAAENAETTKVLGKLSDGVDSRFNAEEAARQKQHDTLSGRLQDVEQDIKVVADNIPREMEGMLRREIATTSESLQLQIELLGQDMAGDMNQRVQEAHDRLTTLDTTLTKRVDEARLEIRGCSERADVLEGATEERIEAINVAMRALRETATEQAAALSDSLVEQQTGSRDHRAKIDLKVRDLATRATELESRLAGATSQVEVLSGAMVRAERGLEHLKLTASSTTVGMDEVRARARTQSSNLQAIGAVIKVHDDALCEIAETTIEMAKKVDPSRRDPRKNSEMAMFAAVQRRKPAEGGDRPAIRSLLTSLHKDDSAAGSVAPSVVEGHE